MGHSALAAAGSANAGKSEDKLLLARHRRCNLFTIPSPMPRQCWGARRRIIYGVIIAPADPLIPIIYEPPAAALFLVSILLSAIPGNPKCPRQCVRPGRQISTNDQQNVLVHALWLTPTEWPLVPSPKLDIRGWPKRNNLRGIGRNSISGRGSAQLHTRPHYLCSGENHQMDEKSPGRESGNEHCVDAPHSCDGMALAQSRAPLSARGIGTHSIVHCQWWVMAKPMPFWLAPAAVHPLLPSVHSRVQIGLSIHHKSPGQRRQWAPDGWGRAFARTVLPCPFLPWQ